MKKRIEIKYIYILDLEYLSWSLKSAQNLNIRKKSQPPEIIQASLIKLSLTNLKKIKLFNVYVKPKFNSIPFRITKLTGITKKKILEKGISFDDAMKQIFRFLDKKSVIICNGNDDQILNINFRINKIKLKSFKKVFFYDFSRLLVKLYPSKLTRTNNLLKVFDLKLNIRPHNAINDCKIIYEVLKKIYKEFGRKFIIKEIFNNLKKFN